VAELKSAADSTMSDGDVLDSCLHNQAWMKYVCCCSCASVQDWVFFVEILSQGFLHVIILLYSVSRKRDQIIFLIASITLGRFL